MINTISNNQNFTLGSDLRFPDNSLQFFVDIKDVSEDLQEKINTAIAEDKQYYTYYISKVGTSEWSEEGINIISTSLNVLINEDKQLTCAINVSYEDKVNPVLWSDICIPVDPTTHEVELKQLMLAAIISRFF